MNKRLQQFPSAWGVRRLVLILLAVLAAAAAVLVFQTFLTGLRLPRNAELTLCCEKDGSMLASWPAAEDAQMYYVRAEFSREAAQPVLELLVDEPGCLLPASEGSLLTFRVQPARESRRGVWREWSLKELQGEPWPEVTGFSAAAGEDGTLRFAWEGAGGDAFFLYQLEADGGSLKIAEEQGGGLELSVGDQGQLLLPPYGEVMEFAVRNVRRENHLVLCSPPSRPAAFRRADFLTAEIRLRAEKTGDNLYAFSWNEAKGDYYLLQYCTDDVPEWADLVRVECSEQPGCEVQLRAGTDYRFRVVSRSGEEELSRSREELELTTGLSTLYATVWPIQDLVLYRDAGRREIMGTAVEAAACCVLEETEGMFYVWTRDGYGYIDSSLCLINLPDYMGELCAYDITNSYDSLYMVHGYEIPGITGTVIPGYEGVRTAESGQLVPLLYPCAQKLAEAAGAARRDGFRLKIYDAYRPGQASKAIYQAAQEHLYDPIPASTYSGIPADDLPEGIPLLSELLARQTREAGQAPGKEPPDEINGWFFWADSQPASAESSAESVPPASSVPASSQPPAREETLPAQTADAPRAEEEPEEYLTYYILMTNGAYRLGSFLAASGSTHNLGIALDLTLERLDTGEELHMQSAMHDLSHYSVLDRNNQEADRLAEYMAEAGFDPLSTEWWHFQDDATRYGLNLKTYQQAGVTLEGWHRDRTGWYYCRPDGSRLKDVRTVIDGRNIAFDAAGYADLPPA